MVRKILAGMVYLSMGIAKGWGHSDELVSPGEGDLEVLARKKNQSRSVKPRETSIPGVERVGWIAKGGVGLQGTGQNRGSFLPFLSMDFAVLPSGCIRH